MEDIIKSLIDDDTFTSVSCVLDYIFECVDNALKLEDIEDACEPLEVEIYKAIQSGQHYSFEWVLGYFEEYEQDKKADEDYKNHISRLWDIR